MPRYRRIRDLSDPQLHQEILDRWSTWSCSIDTTHELQTANRLSALLVELVKRGDECRNRCVCELCFPMLTDPVPPWPLPL